ncbi:MAG: hypothetical protein HN687_08925 [Candidatus Marinimicrobia bacterium]|jgi:hypothetical protein|nr:hypothetical protein [Candidatus Neomarinimicrobiota bacterium]
MRNIILFLISLYLVGCSIHTTTRTTTPKNPKERYEKFLSEISVVSDEFKKTTWVYSAEIPDDNIKPASRGKVLCYERYIGDVLVDSFDCMDARFRSFFNKYNELVFRQIYFVAKLPDWVFFENAVLDDGTDLDLIKIDRVVISGDYLKEYFAVIITEEQYKNMKKRIHKFSLRGKYGSLTIKIPIEIVTSFDDYIKNKFSN